MIFGASSNQPNIVHYFCHCTVSLPKGSVVILHLHQTFYRWAIDDRCIFLITSILSMSREYQSTPAGCHSHHWNLHKPGRWIQTLRCPFPMIFKPVQTISKIHSVISNHWRNEDCTHRSWISCIFSGKILPRRKKWQ